MERNLQTERLILRPFTREDYDLVYAIAADEDTTRYLYYWARMGMTVEEDTQRFLNYAVGGWETARRLVTAVFRSLAKTKQRSAGFCCLRIAVRGM